MNGGVKPRDPTSRRGPLATTSIVMDGRGGPFVMYVYVRMEIVISLYYSERFIRTNDFRYKGTNDFKNQVAGNLQCCSFVGHFSYRSGVLNDKEVFLFSVLITTSREER